jgi:coenzyme F420 hydrogenase subunit beta
VPGKLKQEDLFMALGSLADFKGKSLKTLFADVIDRGLCTACGTCAAVCPKDCMTMAGEEPTVTAASEPCNECGICYACCPGERVELPELEKRFLGANKVVHTQMLGLYRNRYTASAADEKICLSGASAGTAAALQIFALQKGIIDGVLGVTYRADKPWVPVPVLSRTKEEILSTQGSKYTHCSVNDALKPIAREKLRVAVVGLPCHIHGLRKIQSYMENGPLSRSIVFTIGLFCAENRFTRGADHMITRRLGVPLESVARISYREGPYPGAFTVWDKAGKTHSIPYPDQLTFLWMHTRPRCRVCFDYAAEIADISLGETQHLDKKRAHNAALVRTDIGERIFSKAREEGFIVAQDVEEHYIFNHTGLERKKYANLIRIEWCRQHGMPLPDYPPPSVRYEDLPPFYFGPKR